MDGDRLDHRRLDRHNSIGTVEGADARLSWPEAPGRLARARPLEPARSLQPNYDDFAPRCFDATVIERIGLWIHAAEVERHTQLFGIVRTAALGAQLQP